MKSRLCKEFESRKPEIINNIEPISGSLNFSAEFWQPFIDIIVTNDRTTICGPLLGVVIEIAKSFKSSITFVSAGINPDQDEFFKMMDNKVTNMLLSPFPPMTLSNCSSYMEVSSPIGDINTISILSAKGNLKISFFQMMNTFRIEVWILIAFSYLFISGMSAFILKNKKPFIKYLAILFRQQLSKFESNQSLAFIVLIWLWSSSIITWALSSALLIFLVLKTPFEKIDSIEDLSQRDISFTLFKGENAMDFITDPKEKYYKILFDKYVIEYPNKEEKEIWEERIFRKISDGNHAIVSDEPFLNFYFATKLIKYRNLYKSKINGLTLPYFIPMAKNNDHSLKLIIKKTYVKLYFINL
jgi:hypothetical protein